MFPRRSGGGYQGGLVHTNFIIDRSIDRVYCLWCYLRHPVVHDDGPSRPVLDGVEQRRGRIRWNLNLNDEYGRHPVIAY